jgi:hypothetical protein
MAQQLKTFWEDINKSLEFMIKEKIILSESVDETDLSD